MFKWIDIQIEWLKGFFQEPDGKGSMKRLIMFLIVVTFLRTYFRISLATGEISDVSENWMILLLASIGLGIAANYFYKKDPNVEKKSLVDKIRDGLNSNEIVSQGDKRET